MSRRDPQEARTLGLWTAGWLFALLLAGLLRIGDLSLQWPVLLVPVLWALVALRPRRGLARDRSPSRRDRRPEPPDRLDGWPPRDDVPPYPDVPPTREMPASWQQRWPPDVPGRGRRG
ncbi:hypothetical protein [Geodermatophilus maliterrae]|uniref:DUF5668 domain-containing protein n=1 Tax=Geodermatophilus maliterrae TaxID=3162531 RepID=A0ABV3XKS3_9ACTN